MRIFIWEIRKKRITDNCPVLRKTDRQTDRQTDSPVHEDECRKLTNFRKVFVRVSK